MSTVKTSESAQSSSASLAREGPGVLGREEVLGAAAVAFMARGFDGTSIDDIADELKSTKGRIYHYYRSKHAMYLDIRLLQLRMLLEVLRAAQEPKSPADERLRRMIKAQVELVAKERPVMFTAVSSRFVEAPLTGKPELLAAVADINSLLGELEGVYRSAIVDGMKEGVFRKVDAVVIEKTCLAASQLSVLWIHQIPGSPKRVAGELAEYLVRGLLK
jgi:AcrR family transcriptional regulator